jgi:glutamyl-tRNA synthetase
MDWGNAIVRSKEVDASGSVTSIEMVLKLDGDFRKTKKKITWLAQPTLSHTLVDVTLLDYDYLITKKKLGENDKIADVATPVTEFREEALADANVRDVKKGDTIQFERKGYFVLDGTNGGRLEFIKIPDGSAASVASKTATNLNEELGPQVHSSAAPTPPATTKMYQVSRVYGDHIQTPVDTKMYTVRNVYDS